VPGHRARPGPAQKIGPSPATRAYCEQLPAWRTYEQAGERFKAGDQAGDAQAAYFAKYLRSNHGLDGSSRNAQEQAILGPLLGRTVLPRPPVGVTFHNSAERLAHMRQVATENARIKAQSAWETSRREYEDCRRAGRDSCHSPGPRPD